MSEANDDTTADEAPVTFTIKASNEGKYTITVPLTTTVLELKEKLSSKDYADISTDRQRLIYSGRVLKDADTLGTYKIKEGHTIHMVKGAASNQRQNPPSTGNTSASAAAGVPTNFSTGPGNDPLVGLTGARYAGFANLPSRDIFPADGGMGPPPNPEDMMRMMQNPQFAGMLNEALSNPTVIDMMIAQNPMLRGMGPQVRQMFSSPEFRRMMTDPEQMRSMMQLQRMFNGGRPGMGGGAGAEAFPAPGATDTTPTTQAEGQIGGSATQQQQQPNPMAQMFQNMGQGQGAGAGAGAMNPFAALFGNPRAAMGNTPAASPPPPASAGQGSPFVAPGTPSGNEQQQAANPFTNAATSSLFQNPQAMAQLFSSMYPNAGQPGQTPAPANLTNPGDANANNPFAALFQAMGAGGDAGNLFGPFGGMQPQAQQQAPADTRPPQERYAEQLRQLNDMGFYDFDRNVAALGRHGGNVQYALEELLGSGGQ